MLGKSEDLVLAMTISSVSLAMLGGGRGTISFSENSHTIKFQLDSTFELCILNHRLHHAYSSLPLVHSVLCTQSIRHMAIIRLERNARPNYRTKIKRNELESRHQMSNRKRALPWLSIITYISKQESLLYV